MITHKEMEDWADELEMNAEYLQDHALVVAKMIRDAVLRDQRGE